MSATSVELKQKRAALWNQMQDLHKRADENGKLPADAQEQWDKINSDVDDLSRSINQAEKVEKIAREKAEAEGQARETKTQSMSREEALEKWARYLPGTNPLSREQMSMLTRGTDSQTVGTAEHGGNIVATEWSDTITEFMAQYSGMLEVSQIIRTATGGTMYFPTVDETAVKGSKITETTGDTVSDITYTNKQLDAYTYTSGLIKVSYELMQDSAYPLVPHIQNIAATRLGRILNQEATVGDGTGDPNGVVTAASTGKTAASTSAITRDEILDLLHSVDRVYRPNGRFMLNDSTLAAIKKLTVGTSDDRPLWQPSIRDGEPDRIEGAPYTVNNDMAELTDGASSAVLLYGDFNSYIIRMVRDLEMVRLDERYAETRQVGFFSFLRFDGELIDTAGLKKLVLAAS